ncbi:MAG: hypothetical protein MI867_13220, partial [Pseudomonadales bacterium]|nr:hypothetical protein [Pseudomonadales bacterium]
MGSAPAWSNISVQEATFKNQRAMYRRALVLLEKGQKKSFKKETAQLKDYPLYPYLEYFFILRYISRIPQEEIEQFTNAYKDTLLAKRLENHWYKSLARRKQWQTFNTHYIPGNNDTLNCYFYWSAYKTGDKELAFAGAKNLWNVGKSQVKACDPLFAAWKKTEHFTSDIAWERSQKAIKNRKLQLTKYLERYTNPKYHPITQEWRRTYRNPKRLKKISRYQSLGENAKPVIISGFRRLVRKDYQLASKLWPQYETAFDFSSEDKASLMNYFARNMAVNYYPEAENWLDTAVLYPNQEDLIDYGIRHALRDYDWQRVQQWIALLSPAERGNGQWRYWEAKAQQVIGEYNSPLIRYASHAVGYDNETILELEDNSESKNTIDFNILNTHKEFLNGLQ